MLLLLRAAARFCAPAQASCLSLHTIVVNRRFLPRELRPPLWREAALVLTAAFYGLFAVMAALAVRS